MQLRAPTRPATACARRARRVTGKYNNYTVEVVQQIGSDSFDPGHGVLFAKTKNTASSCGNFSCFVWFIDAHPEDINKVDYIGPDGTPVMATPGDERQKNDATFNVGLNSGSLSEYEDTANRLHFYIIDKRTDAAGHPALQGRRQVARRRRPADARRRARRAGARQRRGLHDLHVQPDQHGRGGDDAERPPAGRLGVPDQRRLPALRRRPPARAGARTSRTRSRRRSSASRSRSRSTSRRARAPARSRSTPTSESDPSKTASAVCTLADSGRRRHRRRPRWR